jgi:pimeloyl-CoA synthetase
MNIEALRKELIEFIDYDKGKEVRKTIRDYQIKTYKQKYTDSDHMDFIKRNANGLSIKVQHPQSGNHPYYYGLFTIITQHIMADTVEELYDKAIEIEKGKLACS